jgi:glycosyltransferase involved in cell wall biosynthesis
MNKPQTAGAHAAFSVLFLIENVPYSLDTRVRREAHLIQQLGGSACVICPGDGTGVYKQVDGVSVYQYPKPAWGEGFIAHLSEYTASLFFHSILAAFVYFRHGFDVIHAGNPPDILWLVAAPYKAFGKKYVFDHHDLVPELFQVRYADKMPWLHKVMLWLERRNIRLADHVVSTNDTFRSLAMQRGSKHPNQITVVRNGPWLEEDFPDAPTGREIEKSPGIRVGYLGIMNPQDHLDNLIEAARIIRHDWGRQDITFVLVGSGDAYPGLVALRDRLDLGGTIEMPGTLPWKQVIETLEATDICVQPDPPTVFNRNLTMNKLMEYMALGKAVIAYDMPETRVSGGDSIIYASGESAQDLAATIVALADDPARQYELGTAARKRVEECLSWERQRSSLAEVYRKILPGCVPGNAPATLSE